MIIKVSLNLPLINPPHRAKLNAEDEAMTPATCWSLFLETGDPMFYLLYRGALTAEQAEGKTA